MKHFLLTKNNRKCLYYGNAILLIFILLVQNPFIIHGQNTSYNLNFDGINDYVQLEKPLEMGSTSSTVELWVKVPVVGTNNLDEGERVGIIFGQF